jgi:hypothetical protein
MRDCRCPANVLRPDLVKYWFLSIVFLLVALLVFVGLLGLQKLVG